MPCSMPLGLLAYPEGRSQPADYIYARVAGRRGRLVPGWSPPPTPPSGVADFREVCRAELAWLWGAMDAGLRRTFAPVFGWFELHTWLLCLRWHGAGEVDTVRVLLDGSQLARPIREVLESASGAQGAVAASAQLLAELDPVFSGLQQRYADQGPGAFEQAAVEGYLQAIRRESLHPVVRRFFAELIDIRNLVALAKHLRWGVRIPPSLLAGGTLDLSRLAAIWRKGESAAVLALAGELAGETIAGPELESTLLAGLGRRLRRRGREPLQPGAILDYLWRCRQQARNLELLRRTAQLPDAVLAQEVIA